MTEHIYMLNYKLLETFRQEFYKGLVDESHIDPKMIKLSPLEYTDGSKEYGSFWGWKVSYGNKVYLLSQKYGTSQTIEPKDVLPFRVTKSRQVAHRENVYHEILGLSSAKLSPRQTLRFKELVHRFSDQKHTHPEHLLLVWLLAFTQQYDVAHCRISSPAGFGKDSSIELCRILFGACGSIENPTVAKLEERASFLSWLAISELAGLQAADWKPIQLFLLSVGAFKPAITKRSRAYGGVGETIDVSNFSLSLFYNDIDHYQKVEHFFDNFADKQVCDRFPAFRFYGSFKEDFNAVNNIVDIEKFVRENMDYYKEIVYNTEYYRQQYKTHRNRYKHISFSDYPKRWQTNLARVQRVLDMYADTQEEFTRIETSMVKAMQDYNDMLQYPALFESVLKSLKKHEKTKLEQDMKQYATFTEKVKALKSWGSTGPNYTHSLTLNDLDGGLL